MQGEAPLAEGYNQIMQEQTVIVTAAIYWKPSQFSTLFPDDFRHEDGVIQIKGFCSDLTKWLNCTRMETLNDLGTNHYTFKLLAEPVIPGKVIKSRYFYALWKRV
jgi:hypothetical protein